MNRQRSMWNTKLVNTWFEKTESNVNSCSRTLNTQRDVCVCVWVRERERERSVHKGAGETECSFLCYTAFCAYTWDSLLSNCWKYRVKLNIEEAKTWRKTMKNTKPSYTRITPTPYRKSEPQLLHNLGQIWATLLQILKVLLFHHLIHCLKALQYVCSMSFSAMTHLQIDDTATTLLLVIICPCENHGGKVQGEWKAAETALC
jgi:hypothetical protein